MAACGPAPDWTSQARCQVLLDKTNYNQELSDLRQELSDLARTVHVADVDLTILGHGYVASARGVITDIHSLIHSDLPPERRLGLVRKSTQEGSPYWEILP